jgi:hypothetical protein
MAVAVGPLNVELTLWNLVCHLAPLSASIIKMIQCNEKDIKEFRQPFTKKKLILIFCSYPVN